MKMLTTRVSKKACIDGMVRHTDRAPNTMSGILPPPNAKWMTRFLGCRRLVLLLVAAPAPFVSVSASALSIVRSCEKLFELLKSLVDLLVKTDNRLCYRYKK